jgi:hypothetical protein
VPGLCRNLVDAIGEVSHVGRGVPRGLNVVVWRRGERLRLVPAQACYNNC